MAGEGDPVWPPVLAGRNRKDPLFMAHPDPLVGPPAVSCACSSTVLICYLLALLRPFPVNESNLRFWNPGWAPPRCPPPYPPGPTTVGSALALHLSLRGCLRDDWDWDLDWDLGWRFGYYTKARVVAVLHKSEIQFTCRMHKLSLKKNIFLIVKRF
jgi:hypothetical protein